MAFKYIMPKTLYGDCICNEHTLHFYDCTCGARQEAYEREAAALIPQLSEDQIEALTTVIGAIERQYANRFGFDFETLGISTGMSRSGDNADVLTRMGKVLQTRLIEHARVMKRLSN